MFAKSCWGQRKDQLSGKDEIEDHHNLTITQDIQSTKEKQEHSYTLQLAEEAL